MYVRKLIEWNLMGKDIAEGYINKIVPASEYRKLDNETINRILEIKKYPLRVLEEKEFPNSGYYTDIYIDDDNEIQIRIYKRKGFVLNAFWSEVIIFDIVDHL